MQRMMLLLAVWIGFAGVGVAEENHDKELEASGSNLNQLGVSLLNSLSDQTGNKVVSVWGAHRSLALLGIGSGGETRAQISKALGNAEFWNDTKRLRTSFERDIAQWNGQMEVLSKNGRGSRGISIDWSDPCGVWVDSVVKLRPAFAAAAQNVPGAVVSPLNFRENSGKAIVDINQWISNSTRGRISRVLAGNSVTKDTRCILTAATLFKAPCTSPFTGTQTRREPFAVRAGKNIAVPTMVKKSLFSSAMLDDCTAVAIPASFDFQLLVLVPKSADGLGALKAKLTPELLKGCAHMKESRIELHMPRFRVPATIRSLQESSNALGVRAAFDRSKADFSPMCAEQIYVSSAFEACEFQIDERGLSGSGATAFVSGGFGDPDALPADSTFRVDKPFLFALQHRKSGACLFIGWVTKPE